MENKERDLLKGTKEVMASLYDSKKRPLTISARPLDASTDQITYQDSNGEQVIIVPDNKPDSSS